MKCPHCHNDLPSRECPECHAQTLLDAPYCAFCGAEASLSGPSSEESQEADIDFSDRLLCSDGTCIGVINENGVCTECGKPYSEEDEHV